MDFLSLVCITLPASQFLLPLLQQVYHIGLPLWSPCSWQGLPENGTEWICDMSKLEALANWSFEQRPSMCKAEATTTRLGTIRPACRRFLFHLITAPDFLVNFVYISALKSLDVQEPSHSPHRPSWQSLKTSQAPSPHGFTSHGCNFLCKSASTRRGELPKLSLVVCCLLMPRQVVHMQKLESFEIAQNKKPPWDDSARNCKADHPPKHASPRVDLAWVKGHQVYWVI